MIPFIDLRPQNETLRAEIEAALGRVLDTGAYTLGPEVAAFESEFATSCGARHAVAMNSGTTALHLALLAAGVGPGDDVVTSPFTFIATACAIRYAGANPVFADIDFETRDLDPGAFAKAVTPRTRAVIPVHLYGQVADMDPIRDVARQHGLSVIEDAAQAHGATYHGAAAGTLGALGCFSFYPTKNLGALGEGGLVTTRDAALADALRLLRDWGAREKYQHEIVAYNGQRVYDITELNEMVLGGVPGESVVIDVRRNGQNLQLVIPRGPLGIWGPSPRETRVVLPTEER